MKKKFPIIAFGAGYGGLLATWMLASDKPYVTHAIVSSAPLRGFVGVNGGVQLGEYDKHLVRIFEEHGGCKDGRIRKAFEAIEVAAEKGEYEALNSAFNLEKTMSKEVDGEANELRLFLKQSLSNLAHNNYPYPKSMQIQMRPYPVKTFCSSLNEPDEATFNEKPLDGFVKALKTFSDFESRKRCVLQVSDCITTKRDKAQRFLDCTELAQLKCSSDKDSNTFYQHCKDQDDLLAKLKDSCKRMFPSFDKFEDKVSVDFVSKNFKKDAASLKNIVFVNPMLSPSLAASVRKSNQRPDEARFIFEIQNASTSLDLEPPNTCDTDSVSDERSRVVSILKCWIDGKSESDPLCKTIGDEELASTEQVDDGRKCETVKDGYPWWPKKEDGSTSVSAATTHIAGAITGIFLSALFATLLMI